MHVYRFSYLNLLDTYVLIFPMATPLKQFEDVHDLLLVIFGLNGLSLLFSAMHDGSANHDYRLVMIPKSRWAQRPIIRSEPMARLNCLSGKIQQPWQACKNSRIEKWSLTACALFGWEGGRGAEKLPTKA